MEEYQLPGLPILGDAVSVIPSNIPAIRDEERVSRSSSLTTRQGSSNPRMETIPNSNDYYSIDVTFHSNVVIHDEPKHVFVKTQDDGMKVRIMSLQPCDVTRVVNNFFEEYHDFTSKEADPKPATQDQSVMILEPILRSNEVVNLDDSILEANTSNVAITETTGIIPASLEIIREEYGGDSAPNLSGMSLAE